MSIRKIEIKEYDSNWPVLFEQEKALIQQVLANVVRHIHHIGSTSVPYLAAKPIIDILLEVSSLDELDQYNESMIEIGYEPRGEFGIPRRRYFPKGGMERTHHVHAFESGDSHVVRHLVFRDYLRANPKVAKDYGELKKEVARRSNNDRDAYCDGKNDFVQEIEQKALHELAKNY